MNLKFNILWIEDDYDFYNSTKDFIEGFLNDSCIEPVIEYKRTMSVEDVKTIGNTYDIIFVDYNLPNDLFGTELINKIRSNSLLPDIVFYSSVNSIEEIMEKEKAGGRKELISILKNGIYFSRSLDMEKTALGVIKKILARDEKINGFKGLVLSSISSFEANVDDLLIKLSSMMSDSQLKELYNYIFGHIVKDDLEKIRMLYPEPESGTDNCVGIAISSSNRHLDHNKRVRIMKKSLNILGLYNFDSEGYFQLTSIRNSLGHIPTDNSMLAHPVVIEVGKEKIEFNHEFVVKTRERINYWRTIFEKINKMVGLGNNK